MRCLLLSACALLLLSGCGRNPPDAPRASINPAKDGTSSDSRKGEASDGKKDDNPAAKKDNPTPKKEVPETGVKKDGTPAANGAAFDPGDAHKTLQWLIASAAKVRALPPEDKAVVDKAWADYTHTLKSAAKQKIHWTLPVESIQEGGIVTATVKSPEDPACAGLRLQPSKQPASFETFNLKLPTDSPASKVRAGDRVTVTGVVHSIKTGPGRRAYNAKSYEFHVRIGEYTIAPAQ